MKAESGGSVERPSRNMKVMCCKEPCRDAESRPVTGNLAEVRKQLILDRILSRFFSGNETQRDSKSYKKPTYLTEEAKSWPFVSIRCHGTPRGVVMSKTELKSKENVLIIAPPG